MVPADQGKTVKTLARFPRRLALEVPLDYGLVTLMKKLLNIPLLNGTTGIPFLKPKLDCLNSVVLGSLALHICGVRGEDVLKSAVLPGQPHGKPLADDGFPSLKQFHTAPSFLLGV